MSDEIETGSSAEEQFFNVKTQHGKSIEDSSSDSSGLEIEVIDDTPEAERKPPRQEAANEYGDDVTEEELQTTLTAESGARQNGRCKNMNALVKSFMMKT